MKKSTQFSSKLGILTLGLSLVFAILSLPFLVSNNQNKSYAALISDGGGYCNYSRAGALNGRGCYCGSYTGYKTGCKDGLICKLYSGKSYCM